MASPPSPDHNRFAMLLRFFRSESAGGAVLILAALLALAWSNAPAAPLYEAMLRIPFGLNAGGLAFAMPLERWVNDALMALFFLLVGLEIRREMTQGQLASWRGLATPGIAALGGMAVPALIYAACNWHNDAALRGWAVPMATDIAFSLAVLQALGRRVPLALKIFLTALAIIDDLGAIVVIAIFYTARLEPLMLGLAALLWVALYELRRWGVRALLPYVVGGVLMWVLVFRSGIHATLAGVAMAFVLPMDGEHSPAVKLEEALESWVAFLVLPLFGLCNAGLRLGGLPPGVLRDPVVLGAGLGLLLGKQIGVFGASMLGARLRIAQLPAGVGLRQLYGAAVLCGIGFTMSLFIGNLAFSDKLHETEIKVAVFGGSVLSALFGMAVLAWPKRITRDRSAG